jgi:hypothetical protein
MQRAEGGVGNPGLLDLGQSFCYASSVMEAGATSVCKRLGYIGVYTAVRNALTNCSMKENLGTEAQTC